MKRDPGYARVGRLLDGGRRRPPQRGELDDSGMLFSGTAQWSRRWSQTTINEHQDGGQCEDQDRDHLGLDPVSILCLTNSNSDSRLDNSLKATTGKSNNEVQPTRRRTHRLFGQDRLRRRPRCQRIHRLCLHPLRTRWYLQGRKQQ